MKHVIQTATAAAMYNPVSQATVASNGMFYSAGMVGRSPESGEMLPSFAEQAHQGLRNLGALLNEAGGSYKDVMFVQLYLLDMEKIEQFNEIFKSYFPADPPAERVNEIATPCVMNLLCRVVLFQSASFALAVG